MDIHPPMIQDPQAQTSTSMAQQLLEDLNLMHISDEQKQQLTTKIASLIDKEVTYAIMSRLTDEDITALDEHLGTKGEQALLDEETFQFLQTRIPDLKDVIENALVSLYDKLKETSDILES